MNSAKTFFLLCLPSVLFFFSFFYMMWNVDNLFSLKKAEENIVNDF